MADLQSAIPKGSWVLVTGITGFLASHVTKQLLDRGFKVRGTTRDVSAAAWVTDEMFAEASHRGDLELVALDFAASSDSVYDAAVKGVYGIIHIATIQTFDPDPENVITPVVKAVTSLLKAATHEPTMTRFVYTSSSVAAFMPDFFSDVIISVDRNSWNDVAVAVARGPPAPENPFHGPIVYMASKVEAEKTVWKFAAEEKPKFEVNVVSPYTMVGPVLHPSFETKSLPGWINQLYHEESGMYQHIPGLYYVNVKDVALIHLAALIDPDVKEARIQAWCTPFNWNDILAMWRTQYPHKKFMEDLPNMGKVNAKIDDTEALKLLKKWGGQDGWISLTDGFQETLDSVLPGKDK